MTMDNDQQSSGIPNRNQAREVLWACLEHFKLHASRRRDLGGVLPPNEEAAYLRAAVAARIQMEFCRAWGHLPRASELPKDLPDKPGELIGFPEGKSAARRKARQRSEAAKIAASICKSAGAEGRDAP